ncbi:MAG: hypothetical protein M1838_003209 [Thelocarpon superellum]|nr:MAG: hypothetical protein M1838_003209 [Thelocarpon superellum]
MVTVASLLNPLPSDGTATTTARSTRFTPIDYLTPSADASPCSPSSPATTSGAVPVKAKLTKDAPSFIKGKTRGEVRFEPHEAVDEAVRGQMQRMSLFPLGQIKMYARHIPYNSDKKGFLEKTGRESFEVFQYTFKVVGEHKEYTVIWDYNIGLVRITPFFKCCKYSKTTPAKMLNSNPGLRDICHSITGGALAAQGYWMPYEAAKAVAATFCHPIRYALIPVFGVDFVELCLSPEDPAFGRMVIDREIVQYCTREAERYRAEAVAATATCSREASSVRSGHPTPRLGPAPSLRKQMGKCEGYTESGYGTDTDESDGFLASPQVASHRGDWECVTPKSTTAFSTSSSHATPASAVQTPIVSRPATRTMERRVKRVPSGGNGEDGNEKVPDGQGRHDQRDETHDETHERSSNPPSRRGKVDLPAISAEVSHDAHAAYLLMRLHEDDHSLASQHPNKRRRASTW